MQRKGVGLGGANNWQQQRAFMRLSITANALRRCSIASNEAEAASSEMGVAGELASLSRIPFSRWLDRGLQAFPLLDSCLLYRALQQEAREQP